MKIRNYFAALLPALLFAGSCEDNSEVFYTTTYSIDRIDVLVTLSEPEPEPNPDPENPEPDPENPEPDPENPDPEAGILSGMPFPSPSRAEGTEEGGEGEGGEETPENPIIRIITDDVLAHAPMQAGGSYTLDYIEHDGGALRVVPAPGAEAVPGRFERVPGTPSIRFIYGGKDYTCTLGSYATEQNQTRALLTIDLTTHYQVLYPDQKILQVRLRQYISHAVF